MKKSGLADSPFFSQPTKPNLESSPINEAQSIVKASEKSSPAQGSSTQKPPTDKQSRNIAVMQASNHESNTALLQESMIQLIRRAVKDLGKEPATYRFTPEEKKALMEITYTYKVSGYKTSENELARIAINFIVEDHKQNGHKSLLERVLKALND